MKLLPDIGYPQTGEISDSGTYACMNCPHDKPDDESVIFMPEQGELPECPICGYTYWMKI